MTLSELLSLQRQTETVIADGMAMWRAALEDSEECYDELIGGVMKACYALAIILIRKAKITSREDFEK